MRELQSLDRTLLNSEFELARSLYEQMRSQGYSPFKIAAMIYRHGYLDGRDAQKGKTTEAYKRLAALRATEPQDPISPPEATVEGSTENE